MLRVDVRELRDGPVATEGEIPPGDAFLAGLDLGLAGPLRVTGRLEASGRGDYFWHGRFEGAVRLECRRCLAAIERPLAVGVEVLFSTDPDMQDDPSVYPLPEPLTHVDVRDAVREELVLAAPAYPLCREECRGLCPQCGADLNPGPCGCGAPTTS
jgi:uncharacterized protein